MRGVSIQLNHLERPVEMLDERGAALDPVAVVAIENAAEIADLGVMDVAADDAVDAAAPRLVGDGVAERARCIARRS